MGIVVEKKGNYLKVETDQPNGWAVQAAIHDQPELKTAMGISGINRIEVKKDDAGAYDVERAFDEKYQEKTGRKWFG